MTGLWWINVELFISDWANPPPTNNPDTPLLPFLAVWPSLHDSWRFSEQAVLDFFLNFIFINAVRLANMPRPPPTGLTLHSGISSAFYLLLANYFLAVHSHNNWSCAAASPPSAVPSADLSTFFPSLCRPYSPVFFLSSSKSHPINMLMSW